MRTPVITLGLLLIASAAHAQTDKTWVKSPANPVRGEKLGACFDIGMLREDSGYRMYFSWRDKKSIALVESVDGVHWGEPVIVLPPGKEWESDVNRPVVVKQGDRYLMWYTGQHNGHSAIGFANSSDGKIWQRVGDKPVLEPQQPWEKVAVMCPHVVMMKRRKCFARGTAVGSSIA